MSTEVGKPIQVVNPVSGEALTLDAPTGDLGRCLADIREYEAMIKEAKRVLSTEVLARMDREANWTLRADGLTLKGSSPAPVEQFDELALRSDLLELVDEGVVSVEAVDGAVEVVVTYKVRKAGVNALRKLGGRVKAVIDAHATSVEKDRYVTVSRA